LLILKKVYVKEETLFIAGKSKQLNKQNKK